MFCDGSRKISLISVYDMLDLVTIDASLSFHCFLVISII